MKLLQPSMSRGEMSPGLYGRVDAQTYAIGLKQCLNFITKPTGGVTKRPGLVFRGYTKTNDTRTRLIPFVYSTEIKYLVEMGEGYFRFWVDGVLMSVDGAIVETAHPYSWDDLAMVRYTQSADVLYLVHPNHAQRELRRVTPTSFQLRKFNNKNGPFRALNPNPSAILAMSVQNGNGVLASNIPVFSEDLVGSYVYLEEKELKGVKPWEPTERNVPLGALRRSDGKTYKAVSVPVVAGLPGTPYYICGNTKPMHEFGRAFAGPQDVRNDNVNGYAVGVE